MRIISIAGGKGGIGKTSFSLNLAYALAKLNKRVCIVDADLGLANVNIFLGIEPKYTIDDLIFGDVPVEDIILNIEPNLDLLPGGSGIYRLANLNISQRKKFIEKFKQLKGYDYLIIDNSPGISSAVISFCLASKEVVVLITPEPTSLADGYAFIKTLKERGSFYSPLIVLNKIKEKSQAQDVYSRLKFTCKKFLNFSVPLLGIVSHDENFVKEMEKNKPFITLFPNSKVSNQFLMIAERLVNRPNNEIFKTSVEEFWHKSFINSLISIENSENRKSIKEKIKKIIREVEEIKLELNSFNSFDNKIDEDFKKDLIEAIKGLKEIKERLDFLPEKIKVGILCFDIDMKKLLKDVLTGHFNFSCLDLLDENEKFDSVDVIVWYKDSFKDNMEIKNLKLKKVPILIIKNFLNNGIDKDIKELNYVDVIKAPFDVKVLYQKICDLKKRINEYED